MFCKVRYFIVFFFQSSKKFNWLVFINRKMLIKMVQLEFLDSATNRPRWSVWTNRSLHIYSPEFPKEINRLFIYHELFRKFLDGSHFCWLWSFIGRIDIPLFSFSMLNKLAVMSACMTEAPGFSSSSDKTLYNVLVLKNLWKK